MSAIGCNRHYETFVFRLVKGEIADYGEIDSEGIEWKRGADPYGCDKLAEKMHIKMCMKWAKRGGK
jgi:hypothetical protein